MPDQLIRRFGGTPRKWAVYSKEEADEAGIEYVPWREAEEGEWALTDDNYVCQVVRKTGPHRENGRGLSRHNITLPFCRRWVGTQELLYSEYRRSGMRPWLEDELKTERFKRALNLYARLLLEKGYPLSEADMHAVGMAYRADQKIPAASFQRIIRYEAAKQMLAKELESILAERGVTKESVISMYQQAFAEAEKTGNSATMRSVAKDLSEMLDMKPDKKVEHGIELSSLDWSALNGKEEPPALPPGE